MSSATIAAVATAHGTGGVAVIRVSGEDAAKICDKIFKGKNKLSESVPYMMQYGKIIYDGELIDKVLAVYMKAPHSFTGENTVEINCHGGVLVTQNVLEAVILSGARYAMPGEFTKRAFLNGKLDLTQAEAVADLIDAETNNALYEAVNRMDGLLSKKINKIREEILDIAAQILVVADYPEEDIDFKKKVEGEKQVTKKAKISVAIFLVSMVVIAICGIFPALRPTFSDGTQLAMTSLIQIIMYVAAAIIVIVSKIDSNDILEVPLLKTGFFAVILASGLSWLVNTFVGAQTDFITENLSALTNKYPWIYIIAVFLVGALTSSQASTTMIMIPIAIALKLPAYIIVGGWMACSSNYFIPDSSQCIAGLAFDTAGTTKIGKFIFNHSYMRPGLVCTIVSVLVATGIGYFVF